MSLNAKLNHQKLVLAGRFTEEEAESCLCQADNSLCENSRSEEEIDEYIDEYDSG